MENFKLLWDKAIKPLIDDALNKNNRFQISYGLEKELEIYKDIEARYNNLRDETKREFTFSSSSFTQTTDSYS